MRLLSLDDLMGMIGTHPGSIAWILFALGAVFGVGLASIVSLLTRI